MIRGPLCRNSLTTRSRITLAVHLAGCATLGMVVAACQKSPSQVNQQATADGSTATDFSGVDLNDTKESDAYAAPGEDLAKKAGNGLIGKQAVAVSMTSIDGQVVDLGQVLGKKPVYIKFWATWCVPCRQQMPAFEKMYENLGDKIQFVALNIGLSDDLASIRTFKQKYGLRMPIVVDDGSLARTFNLRVTPQHVLIGRDAKFAYFGHADNKDLADAIQRVLAQPALTGRFAASPVVATAAKTFKVGDSVAGMTAKTTNGTLVPLTAAPGRLRGILFFSSWCEWYLEKSRPVTARACARAREAIAAMATRKDMRVDWAGVSGGPWSSAEDLAQYRAKHKVTIPLALDSSGELFRAFGVRDIPTIVLIDSGGKIVKVIGSGEADLAEAVRVATTRS